LKQERKERDGFSSRLEYKTKPPPERWLFDSVLAKLMNGKF